MSQPDFWNDTKKANQAISRLKSLKAVTVPFQDCSNQHKELSELIEVLDEKDKTSCNHIKAEIDSLKSKVESLEFKSILSGENDKNNAILSINAGAGGTESCDWANMLLRMYSRWAERKKFKISITDILFGEEAGIKNATLMIQGRFAYGWLKSESGVHRLVRISPFDANKRRHTSFASVEVIPEIQEELKVAIDPADLKIDVYRSSGPGGQSVNTTDSAVRITHIPTGIVVVCQNERSQYQNKQTALKILKARLYELERKKQEEQIKQLSGQKQKIEWGSQIRSYIMHPYSMVKDHRTNFQTSNLQAVLDGELDGFMEAYLRKKI